ncbi:DegV family protein [Desmospora profundinema]|uniref:DegV family protein with EDD domain n=1 Tax=Desmospora profundinema TaxID=1571184 RepID=A0ABU1IPW1_9BACL|nr:DegV family protein [Desmospora profundinema]MDR6226815.1 DegV family protein with EDD domain [Desmospora profundinema]
MSKIALVTDSSCDLPVDLLKKWDIHVVPLRIIYKEGEYRDGIDLTPAEVYDRLEEEVPTTSMPSPEDIADTFHRLKKEGYTHCVVLALSANLSGTYNAFRLVAQEVEMKMDVIDSKGLSWVLGFQVLEAARLIREKVDYEEIVVKLEELKEKVKGYFIVDSLEYLREGGRIGKVAASLGSMLNLKPIISLDKEGKFYPHTLARGKNQAMKKLIDPVLKQIQSTKANISILQGRAEEEAAALKERFKEMENVCELYISNISPALVVHTGPGLLGLVVHPVDGETHPSQA